MYKFKDSREAYKELDSSYNAWSEMLTKFSIEASYAIIAANWVVHGGVDKIFNNPWAKGSMVVVFAFLGLNILLTRLMIREFYNRLEYAEEDMDKWDTDYERIKNNPGSFPYTKSIANLGVFLRALKTWAPIIAAVLFICSLF
jgi:hypothetical protein